MDPQRVSVWPTILLLRWCFVPLHNLSSSLRASARTSSPRGAGESSAVGFNTSLRRASDLAAQQQTPHVTNAIRGKFAIPALSCGQTRTICQCGPSGISWAGIETCRYHCPCLLLQSSGAGCPEGPWEAWQRKMYGQRKDTGFDNGNQSPCLWLFCYMPPLLLLWTAEGLHLITAGSRGRAF